MNTTLTRPAVDLKAQRAEYVRVCREQAERDGVAYCDTHGRVKALAAGSCKFCLGIQRAGA